MRAKIAVPASQSVERAAVSGAPARLFVGTSGWAYPTWKPAFYPPKLPAKSFLAFYGSQLTAVEVNYTFRALPTEQMLQGWLNATPPSFRFSFKAPQRITHFQRLRNSEATLTQFLSALEPVRAAGRLGTVLFQLPPTLKADVALLSEFLELPSLTGPHQPQVSFEFRHASWLAEPIYDALRSRNAALCVAHAGDEEGDLATPEIHTASTHTSYRLRRSGGYSQKELAAYAARLGSLATERDLYVALRHEDEPTGALNARDLLRFAGANVA